MATYWENSCSFGLRYVSWYKYLIVSLVFSHLGFWSGNLFLIVPFPDLCLLVPFWSRNLFLIAPFPNHYLLVPFCILEQEKHVTDLKYIFPCMRGVWKHCWPSGSVEIETKQPDTKEKVSFSFSSEILQHYNITMYMSV